MVLCSVTYDGDMFPAMHNFIHHIAAKGLRNRSVGLVENGAWAPLAAKKMTAALEAMHDMQIVTPAVTLRCALHTSDDAALREMASNMAKS